MTRLAGPETAPTASLAIIDYLCWNVCLAGDSHLDEFNYAEAVAFGYPGEVGNLCPVGV